MIPSVLHSESHASVSISSCESTDKTTLCIQSVTTSCLLLFFPCYAIQCYLPFKLHVYELLHFIEQHLEPFIFINLCLVVDAFVYQVIDCDDRRSDVTKELVSHVYAVSFSEDALQYLEQ